MKTNKVSAARIFLNIILLCLIIVVQTSIADSLTHEKCSLENSYCLTKQAQATLQTFVEGDPKLRIKKLDKMKMDPITMNVGGLYYEMWNIEVAGINNTVIDDLNINTNVKIMRISFHTTLIMTGDYKTEGAFLTIPVYGHGKSEFVLNNFQVEIIFVYDIIKNEKGNDVMDIQSFLFGADAIDGVHHNFENLYNGDKAKSDMFHDLINKNWRVIVTNYGRFYTVKIMEHIFQAIKIYMRSRPLEDVALYDRKLH